MTTLLELGRQHGTDKVDHQYLPHYERRMKDKQFDSINLLEIGVMSGKSLRMWADYFSRGIIFGIDVLQNRCFNNERIHCFCGHQEDPAFLRQVIERTGPLDFVIDDGSHRGTHHVASFEVLWPMVKPGGWYCIEDCQSLFNDCWTLPTDRTMLHYAEERWMKIMRGLIDIAEFTVIGDGINDGLIFLRKRIGPCNIL